MGTDGDGYNFCGNGWGWLDFPLPYRSLQCYKARQYKTHDFNNWSLANKSMCTVVRPLLVNCMAAAARTTLIFVCARQDINNNSTVADVSNLHATCRITAAS